MTDEEAKKDIDEAEKDIHEAREDLDKAEKALERAKVEMDGQPQDQQPQQQSQPPAQKEAQPQQPAQPQQQESQDQSQQPAQQPAQPAQQAQPQQPAQGQQAQQPAQQQQDAGASSGGGSGGWQVHYNREECIGAGACVAANADYWSIDEDGKATLKGAQYDESKKVWVLDIEDDAQLQKQRDAAGVCPVNVIHIVDPDGNQEI